MSWISKKKLAFSRSGVSALHRKMEEEMAVLKDTLARKNVWNYVKFDSGCSLDDFKQRGCYLLDGICRETDAGMPDMQCDEFAAMLMVIDATPNGETSNDGVVGQLLFIADSRLGTSLLYTRSCVYAKGYCEWTEWEVCNGNRGPLYDRLQIVEQKIFPLEITLTVSPSAAQEYTGSNKDFTISWTMKIAEETVLPSKLELKVGNDVVPVDIEDVSKIVSVNNDKQVTLIVEADGRAATKTANINFARRYYSAVVDSSWTATNDTVKALAKSALKSVAAATVVYSAATQKKIVFAYPVSHGLMSTIKDAYGNSMFALNDSGKTFNTAPKTVAVTLSGVATLDYYVYESVITNVTAGNITYTTKTFD